MQVYVDVFNTFDRLTSRYFNKQIVGIERSISEYFIFGVIYLLNYIMSVSFRESSPKDRRDISNSLQTYIFFLISKGFSENRRRLRFLKINVE